MDMKRYRLYDVLRNKYTDIEVEEIKKTAKARNEVDDTGH
jgi:hypothetical protein